MNMTKKEQKSELVRMLEDMFYADGFAAIPDRCVRVKDYGAKGDGDTIDTAAIQQAIDAAHAAGGGVVVLEPGTYRCGALFLKSNVELRLNEGAVLQAVQDNDHYPRLPTRIAGIEMDWPAALINVYEQENVRITGKGVIDGNGHYWWHQFWGDDRRGGMMADYEQRGLRWAVDYDCERVRPIVVWKSKNVLLKEFTVQRAGFWTCSLTYSDRVHVDAVVVQNNIDGHGPSSDGINTDSSSHVLVENCDIDCNDDNLCLKSGRDADGLRVNRPAENVVYRNCVTRRGHGMFTLGSETSGGMRNIEVYGLKADGTSAGIRFKSARVRGGVMENIVFHDIDMVNVDQAFRFDLNWFPQYSYPTIPADIPENQIAESWRLLTEPVTPPQRGIPVFRDIRFENITVRDCGTAIIAQAYPESPARGFAWKNISFQVENAGYIEHARDWSMTNVTLAAPNRIQTKYCVNVELPEQATVVQPRCEDKTNPLGIAAAAPRLSWIMDAGADAPRGQAQSAYRVLVASTPALLARNQGDLWDSGKVECNTSVNVAYAGRALTSGQRCHWKVKIWEQNGHAFAWSAPGEWTMGLLHPDDWRGDWLRMPKTDADADADDGDGATAPWFRKNFNLDTVPDRALVYLASAGYHELYVNGRKVGEDVLSPAVSVIPKRALYVTRDIARYLKKGKNTIGVWLGRGWHTTNYLQIDDERPRFRLQADIGGQKLVSDAAWCCAPSPYVTLGPWQWNQYGGERYDARLENPRWCAPEFDASGWGTAEVTDSPSEQISAQVAPLNRIGKRFPAVSCMRTGPDEYILDFGTNLAGWLRLTMPLMEPGRRVQLVYYEEQGRERGGKGYYNAKDEFIAGGMPAEVYQSKFNYHGFRSVVVSGLPAAPQDAEALLIESDLEPTGAFECSNELLNRIDELNQWTLRCLNLGGYQVDCPHRERLGYGDGQVAVESNVFRFRVANFYAQWLQAWMDTQHETGALPFATPYHPPAKGAAEQGTDFGREGPPAWGGTLPVLAWKNYLYQHDRRLLEQAYEPMQRFMGRLDSRCKDGIMEPYGDNWWIGDWLPPKDGPTDRRWEGGQRIPSDHAASVFNNCYLIYLYELMEQSAQTLGRTEDERAYGEKIAYLRQAVHQRFYDPEAQNYGVDEQPYYLMPLMTGVVPEPLRPVILKKLIDNIVETHDGHLDTGMLGTYFMMNHLADIGQADLVYDMINRQTFPGWGYMLAQGATTIWENWNGYWSRIHSCFTGPGGWFQTVLAGMRAAPAAPGFRNTIIRPAVVGDLTWVAAHHDSPYGRIETEWRREGGRLTLNITVPANATATVYVPTTDAASITESGAALDRAEGVRLVQPEPGYAVVEIGSGSYEFASDGCHGNKEH